MATKQLHIISFLVENRPGVLYRVSGMFRRRNFNIESISVGPTERRDTARMTITVEGDEKIVEQVIKQLGKLVDVIKVSRLEEASSVVRELALVKVSADAKSRSDLIHYVNIFRGRIVDISPESATVEITGDSAKIDAFIDLVRPFGIKEVARTGVTALSRGPKPITE